MAGRQPGMAARLETECPRCSRPIRIGQRIIMRRGVAIHVQCASGYDDE